MDSMRIGFLIGALNRGGAERQLAELAIGLKRRGHYVEVLSYDGEGYFDNYLTEHGVTVLTENARTKFSKIKAVRSWVSRSKPHILHGFMKRASSLAVLSSVGNRSLKVVTSDYSTATYAKYKPVLWASLFLFKFADAVVTETTINYDNILKIAPFLDSKVHIIRNGVDTDKFQPSKVDRDNSEFIFITLGTVYRAKNPVRFVQAVQKLKSVTSIPFRVEWYGGIRQHGNETEEYKTAVQLIAEYQLDQVFCFKGPIDSVGKVLQDADALVHVSVQDGIPNAVIEAMATGLPVVLAEVSDLPDIVNEGQNGYVCNPHDIDSISDAMLNMLNLPFDRRQEMGERSRELAETKYGLERYIEEHEQLYRLLVQGA